MTSKSDIGHRLVAARGAETFVLTAGQRIRISDVAGGQVGDLFALSTDDPGEHLSASHTRTATRRLFPTVGDHFVTNRRRPILTLVEDASPGRHDMLVAACDPARYRALGAPGHASCAENFVSALARHGIRRDVAAVPQPVNVFMDVRPTPNGELLWRAAATEPGDSVTFEAAADCLVVLSACPQDLAPVNAAAPSPLAVTIHD
ncbi:urea carboxylase-associated family protein [Streptomyces sp. 8K308]|uniref:DUF1989 domain-containing protein n=1 Tax=Streptomyces sp. 8K308 TaxID=2530388 RepID=UPI00104E9556|nr:urea carboxylase-associated family protein [Streptomyces sp. 8K308]TDC20583.1 urea carboxylase-associated family protein [Streptomyces sp. 8K308]